MSGSCRLSARPSSHLRLGVRLARVLSWMIVRPRTPPGVGTPLRANDHARPPAYREKDWRRVSAAGAWASARPGKTIAQQSVGSMGEKSPAGWAGEKNSFEATRLRTKKDWSLTHRWGEESASKLGRSMVRPCC